MKKTKKIAITVVALIIIWAIFALLPRVKSHKGENPFISKDDYKPFLIAHGGGNLEFPDNTLEAFYNAYSIDPNFMLETDVSITKDNIIILSHDITLDRKTPLKNTYISDVNYTDLFDQKIDFGYENKTKNQLKTSDELIKYKNYNGVGVTPKDVNYPIGIFPRDDEIFLVTTLEELIKSFPNNYINVEIKQSGEIGLRALEHVIKLMDSLNDEYNTYERIVLASFHEEIYSMFKKLQAENPNLMYSPEAKSVTKFFILQKINLDLFYNDKVAVLQIPISQSGFNLATKNLIRNAHRHNIAVHYWTIDDEDEMIKLLEIKADGIMTNKPSLLKEVVNNYLNSNN